MRTTNQILPKPINRPGYAKEQELQFSAEQPVYEKIETEVPFKDIEGVKRKYFKKEVVKTKRTKNLVKEIQAYSPLTEYKSKVMWSDGINGQNLTYVGEKKSMPYYADHTQTQGKTLSEFDKSFKQGQKSVKVISKVADKLSEQRIATEKAKAIAEAKKQIKSEKENK